MKARTIIIGSVVLAAIAKLTQSTKATPAPSTPPPPPIPETECEQLQREALEMVSGLRPEDLRYDVNNNGYVDTGDATLLLRCTPLRCVSAEWGKWIYDKSTRLQHSGCGETACNTKCELANDALDMIAGIMAIDLRYDVNNNGVVDTEDVDLLATGTPLSTSVPAPFAVGDRVLINNNYLGYYLLKSYTGTIVVVIPNGNYVITFDTPNKHGWVDDQMTPQMFTKI